MGMDKWMKWEMDDWDLNGIDNENGNRNGMSMGMGMEWEEMDECKVEMEFNWLDDERIRNWYVCEH